MIRTGEKLQTARDAQRILNQRAQRGASLIEIMIVLVVLLVGIFLAIRIFPVGFGVLRANGNRSIATRLAEQQMNQLRSDVSGLPQGVLFAYPVFDNPTNQTLLKVQTNIDPDNLEQFDANNNGVSSDDEFNPYFLDVNKFRYIKGEAAKVPPPTTTATGSGSVYVCKFGPLLMDPTVGDPTRVPTNANEKALFDSYLAVYGAPMTRVNVESSGAGNFAPAGFFRTQQTYLIDYGEDDGEPAMIAFAPRSGTGNPRTFRITLTYDSGSALVTNTISMTVTDAQAGTWMPLNVNDVVPGSETVAREFDRIPTANAWNSADPYQYKLVSPNITTGITSSFGNIGVLNFNPSGANYSEGTTAGAQPFVAYIDYAVLDWHILREDREVPSVILAGGNTIPIRLTLDHLKRVGDSESDNTIYAGLYGDPDNQVDIQVFNLNDPSGVALQPGTYNGGDVQDVDPFTGISLGTAADYYIETDGRGGTYRTGAIYVNSARIPAGSKLRVLYKAEGDWAMSIQKAYSNYEVARDPDNPALFSALPLPGNVSHFGIAGTGAGAQLRFPFTDLNKAFVVTVQYTLQDGTVKRLQPIQMTATEVFEDPGADAAKFDQRSAAVLVANFLPSGLVNEFTNATNWTVTTCQGVSVKSRIIWRETDSRRWKVQDMDSYLTPKPVE